MKSFATPSIAPQTSSKLQELYQYMCLAAPFGTPMDTNPTTIRHHLQYKGAKPASSPKLKVWHHLHSITHSLSHFSPSNPHGDPRSTEVALVFSWLSGRRLRQCSMTNRRWPMFGSSMARYSARYGDSLVPIPFRMVWKLWFESIHMHMHIRTHTYAHIRTHTHVHVHVDTHTHTHRQNWRVTRTFTSHWPHPQGASLLTTLLSTPVCSLLMFQAPPPVALPRIAGRSVFQLL